MIFSESLFALVLLAAVVILPIIAALINRITPRVSFQADIPEHCEKNEVINGSILISNQRHMIYRCVKMKLSLKNLLTGETAGERVVCTLYSLGSGNFKVKYKSKYCGVIAVSCEEARVYDFFGLTYRKADIAQRKKVTVLPEVFPIDIRLKASKVNYGELQSNAEKKGQDLSEVYDFREYVPGDSPRQIQWKLSQKHDALIVKQGSVPAEQNVLLIFAGGAKAEPAECSAAAEVFISISQSLCEARIAHSVVLCDDGDVLRYEIECEDDLAAVMIKLLSAHGESLQSIFEQNEDIYDFEHVVCVTADVKAAEYAAGLCTAVLFAGDGGYDGITAFSADMAVEELYEIEI